MTYEIAFSTEKNSTEHQIPCTSTTSTQHLTQLLDDCVLKLTFKPGKLNHRKWSDTTQQPLQFYSIKNYEFRFGTRGQFHKTQNVSILLHKRNKIKFRPFSMYVKCRNLSEIVE